MSMQLSTSSIRFLAAPILGLLLLCVIFPVQADQLTASADRQQIAINETLQVRVRYDGQTLGEPDFSALRYDWEIIHNQRQSHLAYGGGQNLSYTQWSLTLSPKRKGKLMVPSFSLNAVVSDAIEIEVGDAPPAGSSDQPVFIETELDKLRVYVQEQILLTLRFHTSVMLNNFSATELRIPGAQVLKVNETQYQKTIDGTTYTVVETSYAIFPEKSGDLTIPPVRFGGAIPDPRSPLSHPLFGGTSKQILLRSEPRTVSVRPIPDPADLEHWLPTKGLSLAQRWSRPIDQLVVGEPVTRTIVISAQGLTGAQLPPLDMADDDGYRLYPDQPAIEDQPVKSGIVGTRTESMAIVPTRPGEISLPPVKLRWWDTVSGTVRETVLDGETLKVAPATVTGSPPPAVSVTPETAAGAPAIGTQESGGNAWLLWILATGNLLWLGLAAIFAGLWWQNRGDKTGPGPGSDSKPAQNEQQAFAKIKHAARDGATRELRQAILSWARLFWPRVEIRQLQQVASLCGQEELQRQFRQLDRFLFSNSEDSSPDLNSILACLKTARKNSATETRPQSALKPLYPV